jgi:23S rRNA (cytosine1962-C5)-methyltransferase
VYGETALLELLSEGTQSWQTDLEEAAREVFVPRQLQVRRSGEARDRGVTRGLREPSPPGELAAFRENGLTFFADTASGQKTGFYLDQRENRLRVRGLAAGRTVLNLFAYSGAFSVAALAGGARRAVDVDSSERALELARLHRRENGLAAEEADFVRADVFEDLRRRVEAGESWDLVVCDPPALAKKRGEVARAARAYKDANRLAMSLVSPGGWLLTCSCSGAVDADLFQKIVFSASLESGGTFAFTSRQGAGPDHPVSLDCPEGEYLKGLWLYRQA